MFRHGEKGWGTHKVPCAQSFMCLVSFSRGHELQPPTTFSSTACTMCCQYEAISFAYVCPGHSITNQNSMVYAVFVEVGRSGDVSCIICRLLRLLSPLCTAGSDRCLCALCTTLASAKQSSTYFSHFSHQPNSGGSPIVNGGSTYKR